MPVYMQKSFRRGITLLELAIVLLIMSIAAALIIPQVKSTLDEQQIREAARQVDAYFARAQALASERGRPVGVGLRRSVDDNNLVRQLYIAEVPQAYSGDSLDARVTLASDNWDVNDEVGLAFDATSNSLINSQAIIQTGESFSIRFEFKGHLYPAIRKSSSSFVIQKLPGQEFALPPLSEDAAGTKLSYRYQIFRQPKESSIRALQLPGNAVVDLSLSGFGVRGNEFIDPGNASPVIIMYNPSGSMDSVYLNNANNRPTGTVHLFVGESDAVRSAGNLTAADANLSGLSNFWVSLGHRAGAIKVSKNAGSASQSVFLNKLPLARKFAISPTTAGGKE